MSDADWKLRLRRSRQALKSWIWESGLPWVDRDLTRSIAETEIGALKHYQPHMPIRLRAQVGPLLLEWDKLRQRMLN
jgi:hypothetical protein